MKNIWNAYKSSIILLGAMVIGGVVGFFWKKARQSFSQLQTCF